MPVLVRGNWMAMPLFQRRTSPLMITWLPASATRIWKMLVLLARNTQIRFLNERLNSRNSLKTNLRNASLKSSHSLKLKLLKLNKNLKQHSHRPSKWLQATLLKLLASKKLLPRLKPNKKNSKKVKQWLIIYQRLAINSTLVERFRVLRDMLLMKVILTSFTMWVTSSLSLSTLWQLWLPL